MVKKILLEVTAPFVVRERREVYEFSCREIDFA